MRTAIDDRDEVSAPLPLNAPEVASAAAGLLDLLPGPAWMAGADGASAQANAAWRSFLGVDALAADGGNWLEHIDDQDRPRLTAKWAAAWTHRTAFHEEARVRHHDGRVRWMLLQAAPAARDAGGVERTGPAAVPWRCVVATDIHAQIDARQSLVEHASLRDEMLDVSLDCIKILDPHGRLLKMNRTGRRVLGLPENDGELGMRWADLVPLSLRARVQRAITRARSGHNTRFTCSILTDVHQPCHWENILSPILDATGRTSAILCVSRDVTAQREAESRLRRASEIDDLTDLPNRRSFKAGLQRAIGRARQAGTSVGLLLIDLDHFKTVNDTLGHRAGDHLLRVLSRRLRAALPPATMIARLGGDEFAVVVEGDPDDVPDSESRVGDIANRIIRQLEAPICHSGRVINGGMSVGGAVFPRDAWDASALMACADTALNDLKVGGRGGIRMFSERMTCAARSAASQLNLARSLIRDDVIEAHYQPKVALEGGTVVGFEALLRWRNPSGTLEFPGHVAEAFKDYELATGLANRMHAQVLADMAVWRDAGLSLLPVSINAAPVEFMRGDFADKLLGRLAAHAIPPALIEIEVTEHILLERGVEFVATALRELKRHGVRIALDDFGTGHSSIAHLRDYPVDIVKIDRSFVARMVDDPSILAIVEAISRLGPALSVDVIAEGIETERQCSILLAAGCWLGQGYLFGAATTARDVGARLLRTCGFSACSASRRRAASPG